MRLLRTDEENKEDRRKWKQLYGCLSINSDGSMKVSKCHSKANKGETTGQAMV